MQEESSKFWRGFLIGLAGVVAIVALVILIVGLVRLGNAESQDTTPNPGVRPVASPSFNVDSRIAPIADCIEVSTQELFVMAKWQCPNGTLVYTFATPEQRTQWREVAEPLGIVVLDQGNLWIKVKDIAQP